jgi:hypothetical protein
MHIARLLAAALVTFLATSVAAQETVPAPADIAGTAPTGSRKQFPALGGHLGFAVPIGTLSKHTTVIGDDFFTLGLTPGLTVHLDDKWAVDFEFIAFNEIKNSPSATTFVVDPGVIRKFDGFVAGLRVASRVGFPTNVGIVPIFVLPVRISETLVYFFEADIPVFFVDNGAGAQASATFLFQSGFGF